MAATLYLAGSIFILVVAASAWFQARRVGPLVPVYFMTGWLAGDLALQVIAVGVGVTLLFAALGAFAEPRGILGLTLSLGAWGLLLASHFRAQGARREIEDFARETSLAIEHGDITRTHGFWRPFQMKRAGVRRISNIPYGESLPGDKGGRNLLDIVLPDAPGTNRPILVQIHGGGWMIGDKREQGGPLMGYLASRGWVCFAINYRLSPKAKFPAHIVDVKRALRWIREHAHEYGADPSFLCVTGGSAGGHLTALTALSQNDPAFQPGFEEADTQRLGRRAVLRRLRLPRPRQHPRSPPFDGRHPDQIRLPVSSRRESRALGCGLSDHARVRRRAAVPRRAGYARHARVRGRGA